MSELDQCKKEKHDISKRSQETFDKITQAIEYLRENHIPVTKSKICAETNLHPNSMSLPHIREFLNTFPEFQTPHPKTDVLKSIDDYIQENKSLQERLKVSQNKNKRLEQTIIGLREELKEVNLDYKKLLGAYQENCGNKIIHI